VSEPAPSFVDHHVHLLRVAAGVLPPYDYTDPSSIAAFHRGIAARGSTPMDEGADAPPTDDLEAALAAGLGRAARLGLVGVTEAGMNSWRYWDALVALRERGALAIDVRVLLASGLLDDAGRIREAVGGGDADGRLAVAGVKLYADGWLGPRTCACSVPFADVDPPDNGVLFLDADTLAQRVDRVAALGLRPATHAIGDRAIASALDAYERAYGSAAACRAAAPRIEHAQLLRPDLIERIVELGVVCCIQPCFESSDAASFARGFGDADEFPLAYRWDVLLGAGASVIAGSDFPIETLDPVVGLERLTTGAHPLDRATALAIMTTPLGE